MGEGDAAGEEQGSGAGVPCTIFVVAHQGEAPAGELDPDLVAAAGMEPDADQTGFSGRQTGKFQPGVFHALAFFFHGEDLVFPAVLEEEILPVAAFRRCAVDHGHIFLDHSAFLDGLTQGRGGLFGTGVDHDAAHVQVQPVNGEYFAPQGFLQRSRNAHFGIQPHGLDDHGNIPVRIQQFQITASFRTIIAHICKKAKEISFLRICCACNFGNLVYNGMQKTVFKKEVVQ